RNSAARDFEVARAWQSAAVQSLTRGTARVRPARVLLSKRAGLRQRDGTAPADALRDCRFADWPCRLDARPRCVQLRADSARLRRRRRRAYTRRHSGQRDALLAYEHGYLVGPFVLGYETTARTGRILRRTGRADPGCGQCLRGRNLRSS